jgi:peptidoglycan/xylan/chitin deacetylase (PgdA/CDA1 family)
MKKSLISIIDGVDKLISDNYCHFFNDKNALITFLFHGLFNDESEINRNYVDPQQGITTNMFRRFIEYYLRNGFIFVSPYDILNGLETDKNYVLITFDDGYYNNHLALSILQEYQVPAIFFISSNHVLNNKSFWWDVIYRERVKENIPLEQISKELVKLKHNKNDEIEQYLVDSFGENASTPICDVDRPFTPSELKDLSSDPLVFLGNHTGNHAILTNLSHSEIKLEIDYSQNFIFNLTGIMPIMIAYPNGNFSEEVLNISQKAGLKLGITTNPKKNLLPINLKGLHPFALNRFILWGNKNIEQQCSAFRSDIQFSNFVRKLWTSKEQVSL